jgi:hypothetical protein
MRQGRVATVFYGFAALAVMSAWSSRVAAAEPCDAACLRGFTQQYIDALTQGDPGRLPLAAGAKSTENGQPSGPGQGLWKTAVKFGGYRFFIEDPSTSRASFVGVFEQGAAPAILWLCLKIDRGKISEAETIVARKGSHPLFAPEALTVPYPGFSESVAPRDRGSRKELIAAANSYLDGIEQHDSRVVRADPACDRIENGVQTTHRPGRAESQGCASSVDGLKHIKRVDHRRFPIVDREHGVVMAVFTFDIPGEAAPAASPAKNAVAIATPATSPRQPRTLLLMELFKVVGGRITRIEAVMHNLPYGGLPGWL